MVAYHSRAYNLGFDGFCRRRIALGRIKKAVRRISRPVVGKAFAGRKGKSYKKLILGNKFFKGTEGKQFKAV